jgi:hypothetical protein
MSRKITIYQCNFDATHAVHRFRFILVLFACQATRPFGDTPFAFCIGTGKLIFQRFNVYMATLCNIVEIACCKFALLNWQARARRV